MTGGKPDLFVGSPASQTTSAQLDSRLKFVIDSHKKDSQAGSSTQATPTSSKLMPPPARALFKPNYEKPQTRTTSKKSVEDSNVN